MPNDAISAQGTLIARAPAATPTTFANIGNMMDISGPALMRNEIETTSHNDTEESFTVGIKRKGPLTFQLGYLPGNPSHGLVSGLLKAWNDGSRDVYKITWPDSTLWLFSGYVVNFAPGAPVDDLLTADVTIRPTHQGIYN
jgi:hypothetical protein